MRNSKRLIVAALISGGCWAGTDYWYELNRPKSNNSGALKSIALLEDVDNEVQRKARGRTFWETVTRNQDLFAGENIRTLKASEARILFKSSGLVIDLEPDSEITIEENREGLALTFLKGNLFVKSQTFAGGARGPAAKKITLKTKNSEIDLAEADLSISETKTGDVSLDVFKGKAELKNKNGEKVILDSEKSGVISDEGKVKVTEEQFQIISPLPNQDVYIDVYKREPVAFQWKPLSEGYKVYLERGSSRSDLRRNQDVEAGGQSGELKASSKVAKYYWRLVAESTDPAKPTIVSKTFPVRVVAKTPPTLVSPKNQDPYILSKDQPKLEFRWVADSKHESLFLEVAKDAGLRNKVIEQALPTNTDHMTFDLQAAGTYFWRITGYINIEGKKEAVSSQIWSFDLGINSKLVPPDLGSPLADQNFKYQDVKEKGIYFTWKSVPGITVYQLKVIDSQSKKTVVSQDVTALQYKAINIPPGEYKWSVASVNSENKKSRFATSRELKIQSLDPIQFARGDKPESFRYVTEKPYALVEYVAQPGLDYYQVRFADSQSGVEEAAWMDKQAGEPFKVPVPQDDRYYFQVGGFNLSGQQLSASAVKPIVVAQQPLLPAPDFSRGLASTIKANRRGAVKVEWEELKGAAEYKVVLKDKSGTVVAESQVKGTSHQFSKLKPGDYQVSLYAVDSYNRVSEKARTRDLVVPNVSSVQAPKIKKIKVK